MDEGEVAMTSFHEMVGGKIPQRPAGKGNGVGVLNRLRVKADKDDVIDAPLSRKGDFLSREAERRGDDPDRVASKDRLIQALSFLF